MKKLAEFIKESLITEASGEFLVFYDHESPDDIKVVYGANKQQIKKLSDYDCIIDSVPWKGNLMVVENDDETLRIFDTGCKNISQLKNKVLKEISDCLKNADDDYVELDIPSIGLYIKFGDGCNEHILKGKGVKEVKPEVYYDSFIEFFNDSYVDNDSVSQYLLIDAPKSTVIWGPQTAMIMDSNELEAWLNQSDDTEYDYDGPAMYQIGIFDKNGVSTTGMFDEKGKEIHNEKTTDDISKVEQELIKNIKKGVFDKFKDVYQTVNNKSYAIYLYRSTNGGRDFYLYSKFDFNGNRL